MRGGYANVSRAELAKLVGIIEQLGLELVSTHQTQKGVLEKEKRLASEEIHDRDYAWLKEADAGIFEVSNPSLGVGAEISDIVHLGKPILCLYKKEFEPVISAYILGKERSRAVETIFECRAYATLAEAKKIIKNFVENAVAQK
ncbi:MAG: nucleoside 2-deoxyribosyltransferase [Candidatus Diapherotrites archaeon]|nr:nucleoside 2-deoxyribosyltransferase [Candidatus Diapherotrites archaeon]